MSIFSISQDPRAVGSGSPFLLLAGHIHHPEAAGPLLDDGKRPRRHIYWPDSSRLYCSQCGLPRRHPIHDLPDTPADPRDPR